MLVVALWAVLITGGLIVAAVLLLGTTTEEDVDWYKKRKAQVLMAPPSWVFPVVWPILYVLITLAIILYELSPLSAPLPDIGTLEASYNYVVTMCLLAINIVANLWWTRIFFADRNAILALFDLMIVVATGVAAFARMLIDGQTRSAWMYFPYVVWTLFALVLNINWVCRYPRNDMVRRTWYLPKPAADLTPGGVSAAKRIIVQRQ